MAKAPDQYLVYLTGDCNCSEIVDGIEGIEEAYIRNVLGGDIAAAHDDEIHLLRARLYGNAEWKFSDDKRPFCISWGFEDGSMTAVLIMERAKDRADPIPSWEELAAEWSNRFLQSIKMPPGERDKEIRASLKEFIRAHSLFEKFVKIGVQIGEANANKAGK